MLVSPNSTMQCAGHLGGEPADLNTKVNPFLIMPKHLETGECVMFNTPIGIEIQHYKHIIENSNTEVLESAVCCQFEQHAIDLHRQIVTWIHIR